MRFLKESLLSLFVVAVVLYLYFVAAGAALLSLCGLLLPPDGLETLHHLKALTDVTSPNQIHTTGELQ
jgi:hypothetical protein